MPDGPIKLAVFGAGRIGAVHAANAATLQNAHLAGVADVNEEAARKLVARCGGRVAGVASFLADPGVTGVVVATPTGTHAGLVALAAAAGKHVFVEKPISLDIAETIAAIGHAKRAGVILQVGFQRRFDPEFVRARESVATGELGSPRFVRLVGRDHAVPPLAYLRTSGGQFKDQMIHEFDLAAWLLQPARVVEVYAAGSAIVAPEMSSFGDADTTVATVRYDSGVLGVIDGSREAVYGYDVRAELVGSKGMLLVGSERLVNGRLLSVAALTPDREGFAERFAGAYRAELEDFVKAVSERRPPKVGGLDALEALRLATAATMSFRENRVVRMSELADA